jgi:uncharacterized RDD family membrane protein YckC
MASTRSKDSVVTFAGRRSRSFQPDKIVYAGFWRRFAAWLIDTVLISLVLYPLILIPTGLWSWEWGVPRLQFQESFVYFYNHYYQFSIPPSKYWLLTVFSYVPSALYFALFHASKKQATLGMRVLSLKVTDYEGKRISFARALGRYVASFVTAFTCGVGYLMIVFTRRKQALHDMISETYIIFSRDHDRY